VVTSVRRVFYETLALERRADVQGRLAALVSEAVGVTGQLFNVGAADRPDFLEVEIEARRAQLDVNRTRNLLFAARQRLAMVVGTPEVASRPLSGAVDQPLPEIEREAALAALRDRSPLVQAARAEVSRAAASTASARRATFPDLFVRAGAARNRERGEDTRRPIGWEGTIEAGISIPLFNRNSGAVAAALADQRRAEADLARVELSLGARLAAEFATYLTAVREAESYRADLLPRAEEAYRLYLARYREMAAAYPQVLIAQRTLLELTTRYVESLDMAWRAALTIQGLLAGDALDAPGAAVRAMEADDLQGEHP
jgi:cobalt-zinc-cadmium efflux system outer membrane protein